MLRISLQDKLILTILIAIIMLAYIIISYEQRKNNHLARANPYYTGTHQLPMRTYTYHKTQHFLQQQDISGALASIPLQTLQDHYNYGTLQVAYVQELSLSDQLTDHQKARQYSKQAVEHLALAAEQSMTGSKLHTYSTHNYYHAQAIDSLVHIQACYHELSFMQSSVNDIQDNLEQLNTQLEQTTQSLAQNSKIDPICREQLNETLDQTKEILTKSKQQFDDYMNTYNSLYRQLEFEPELCIHIDLSSITSELPSLRDNLQMFYASQQQAYQAITSNNTQAIQALCNQEKNDAQINQDLSQQLAQTLANMNPEQRQQRQEAKQQENETNSSQTIYQDISEAEQLMQIMQQQNDEYIRSIFKVQEEEKNIQYYIQKLFRDFFGNLEG